MDRAMRAQIDAERLADLTVPMPALELNETQLSRFAALPNVVAVEPRTRFDARIYVGERRAPAEILGIPAFDRQRVDVVQVESGAVPGPGEVLVDVQDADQGVYDGAVGDTVHVIAADGSEQSLRITGEGRSLGGGRDVTDDRVAVFYGRPDTVAALSGTPGYDSLAFRLRDNSPGAVRKTVADVRGLLDTYPGFAGFSNLPEVRAPGDWPGREDFNRFTDFFYVVTLLALLAALVLISNTVTTLVAEQTREIGIMRAVGGSRRQIRTVYLRTAMLLGAVGSVTGAVLGIVVSNALVGFVGSTFFAVDAGIGVVPAVLAASVAVGVLGPALVALPAIRRGLRVDLREALEATGSASGGEGAGDRVLRRARFLPRTVQIGLRGAARRKRRSTATAVIVGLAVGNLLAVLGLAAAIAETTRAEWRDHGEDVRLTASGARPLDARAAAIIRGTPGVAEAQPALVNDVTLRGREAFVWAVPRRTLFRYELSEGRWFTRAEEQGLARVVVVERNIARVSGIEPGDRVRVGTAAGPAAFRVVGIAANQQENGTVLFAPLTTVRSLLGAPGRVDHFWVRTTSSAHDVVDRTTTRLEDRLAAGGYAVGTEITYVGTRDNVAANRTITTTIAVFGLLIVAISMVGLANAVTMSVLERTREIGVLRCLGARARDLRRIFTTEGVAVALAGWLVGIPLGYLLDRFLVRLLQDVVNIDVPFRFPAANVGLALVGTVVFAVLIISLPVSRAARLRPGEAIRYE
jgi:putative ABC transport system permease protein